LVTIEEYLVPETIEAAYKLLKENRRNTVLGGGTFLSLTSKKIKTAIDLSNLGLSYIRDEGHTIEIGAMTSLRDVEVSGLMQTYFSGILSSCVKNIVGVQYRNMATVGANVYLRNGFGDMITALLSLNAEVVLYNEGNILLNEFMHRENDREILEKIIIPKADVKASYNSFRNSYSDLPILNVTVSKNCTEWKIVVGARPGTAEIALNSSKYLSESSLEEKDISHAARLAVEELKFSSDMRASEKYRKNICEVMVRRAIQEVLFCK